MTGPHGGGYWQGFVRGDVVTVDGQDQLFQFHKYDEEDDVIIVLDLHGAVWNLPPDPESVHRVEAGKATAWKSRSHEVTTRRQNVTMFWGFTKGIAFLIAVAIGTGVLGLIAVAAVAPAFGLLETLLPVLIGLAVVAGIAYMARDSWR